VFSQLRKQKFVNYDSNVSAPLTSNELALIIEVYGDTANENVLDNPQRLTDIKNILRNRIEIKTISKSSDQKACPLLSEVPLMDYYVSNLQRDTVFNPQTFNPLKYLFQYHAYGSYLYRVDGTDYFIIVKSQHQ
jgi:hypothetical protein